MEESQLRCKREKRRARGRFEGAYTEPTMHTNAGYSGNIISKAVAPPTADKFTSDHTIPELI